MRSLVLGMITSGCMLVTACMGDKIVAWQGDAGADACTDPWVDCDDIADNGCEVNQNTDPDNCGGCGVECSATSQCEQGQCGLDGVDCNGAVCNPPERCCWENGVGEYCYDPGTESCPGMDAEPCDGPEDCDAGQFCCHNPADQFAECVDVCSTDIVFCAQEDDCRSQKPFCCPMMGVFSVCTSNPC